MMMIISAKYHLMLLAVCWFYSFVARSDLIETHSMKINSSSQAASSSSIDDPPTTHDWCFTKARIRQHSFKWTISDYSLLTEPTGESLNSTTFPAGATHKYKWQLQVYPRGINHDNKNFLSVRLALVSANADVVLPLHATFKFAILNNKNEKVLKLAGDIPRDFRIGGMWGFNQMAHKDVLYDRRAELLPGDKLTILCEFKVLTGSMKYSGRVTECPSNTCSLPDDLGDMFESQLLADINVDVSGREFKVHKAIMAARSPVFRAMFTLDMQEAQFSRLEVSDIQPEVFEQVLRYIYTGAPKLTARAEEELAKDDEHDFVIELLKAASKYQLDGLKQVCEQHLYGNLTVQSVIDILSLADQYYSSLLRDKCLEFIFDHASDVFETDNSNRLLQENPALLAEIYRQFVGRPPGAAGVVKPSTQT